MFLKKINSYIKTLINYSFFFKGKLQAEGKPLDVVNQVPETPFNALDDGLSSDLPFSELVGPEFA